MHLYSKINRSVCRLCSLREPYCAILFRELKHNKTHVSDKVSSRIQLSHTRCLIVGCELGYA